MASQNEITNARRSAILAQYILKRRKIPSSDYGIWYNKILKAYDNRSAKKALNTESRLAYFTYFMQMFQIFLTPDILDTLALSDFERKVIHHFYAGKTPYPSSFKEENISQRKFYGKMIGVMRKLRMAMTVKLEVLQHYSEMQMHYMALLAEVHDLRMIDQENWGKPFYDYIPIDILKMPVDVYFSLPAPLIEWFYANDILTVKDLILHKYDYDIGDDNLQLVHDQLKKKGLHRIGL